MKNVNKIIMVIIGTLVGAGFASGREIYLFFGKYGAKGLLGIIISGVLSAFIIYTVLKNINENQIYNYSDFLKKLNLSNKNINEIIQLIVKRNGENKFDNSALPIAFYNNFRNKKYTIFVSNKTTVSVKAWNRKFFNK